MTGSRLHTLLIPAVGGQGGGVLAEWIVEAATRAGLGAHGTSIPGVAQRTGSTTYYVEVYRGQGAPVFSLYPVPGALDVLLAPEFLEVGRAIELGFPSPERTTIIASTHRLLSIHEKVATGRALYPAADLEAAARAFSRAFVGFDALAVAREHATEANAVLLGALAGTEALPIGPEAYREAIRAKGVQVEANLRGFAVGLELAGSRAPAPPPPAPASRPAPVPPALAGRLAGLPEGLRPLVAQALARLADYQDQAYAARYLDRLAPLAAADAGVAESVARYLALWMTYEDAIRVADLKTRAGRLERIRGEAGAGPGQLVVVTDYLKPDLDELYGVLPARLVGPFARWAERRWPHGRPTPGQHVRTTTVLGYLRLWLLARCRRLRPRSFRAAREHERMERWLDAVRRAAARDAALAREVARAAQLVKGYGEVRRRLLGLVDDLLARVGAAADLEAAGGQGFPVATALAETYRRLVLAGPETEARAPALAAEVVRRLEGGEPAAALAALRAAAPPA